MVDGVRGSTLVGRTDELRMGCDLVDALLAGRGGSMVITGSSGVGKTALARAIAAEAQSPRYDAARIAVSMVTAAESERDWPYSGLHLVVSGMVGALSPGDQPGVETLVAELFGRLDEASGPREVAMELLPLIGAMEQPVLAAVDDAQFLDARSHEALGIIARRLGALSLTLVVVGEWSAGSAPVLDGLPTLRLRELASEDVVDLLQGAYPDMAGTVAEELGSRAGGNPRTLLDVADRLSPEQRRGQITLDRYLPTSTAVRDMVLAELDELNDGQRFALLVAAASEDDRIGPVLTASADEAGDVGQWLLSRHLEASDGSYRWRRPAVGWIAWRASNLDERRRVHERLAEAYDGLDAERVSWHRAGAQDEPDEDLAAELEQASRELRQRGELARSYLFARESVRLTAGSRKRVERSLSTGKLAAFAGRADEAMRIARERNRADVSGEQGAELALLEVRAHLIDDGHVPTDLIEVHADALMDTDPDRAAQFWLVGAAGFADRLELDDAVDYLTRVERHLPLLCPDTVGSYRRITAWIAALSGEFDRAAMLIEADGPASGVFAEADRCLRHAMVLTRAERFDEARRLLQIITEQRRFGDSSAVVGNAWSVAGVLEIRAGRLAAAKKAAESWRRVVGPHPPHQGRIPAYMIRAHALMGDVEAALQCQEAAQTLARDRGDWWTRALVQSESGAMYLRLNQLDEAMSALERARHYALACDDPSVLATEPDFIEACVQRGDLERARAALAAYEARASRVPTSWARHTVARCRALVAEGEESVELFAVAAQTCSDSASPVELARTQLCCGERLGELGRHPEAVEWLHRAIVLATESGATGLATRAQEELGSVARGVLAIPRQRRALDPLTESERRLVALVVAGRRNREIAAELFVSVRTVETHLGKIYRKLGVRSRAELAGMAVAAHASSDGTDESSRD
ncbi:LuxR family transcriptional regulator [Phytoactinopolyspora endophytica]|uniref:LuxR C-terminal-related transcriptional regulator n=1 Tax=Phytoactinopolyspora endophytica TaxID=1642495 RepID=UPI00101BBB64|nr:LuxR family transcriptional regulator [Phytoactinopolyspora endophytica]